jgi:chloramphenicol 3-O phosphotransferase
MTIVLLIGTSSAGKSTLANALQAILSEHYLLFGLDDMFRMVSPRWGGGLAGPLSYDGFRYDRTSVSGMVTIRYGSVGQAILDGMHYAVAAFAQAGSNVIVDEMLLDRGVLSGWAHALAPCHTYLIKVRAELTMLEAREVQRGHPPGLARGHYWVNDIPVCDRLIDTGSTPPEDAADEMALWMRNNPQPQALKQYRS